MKPPDGVDGSGLIFITGAPGSKWSSIAHAISFADPIDSSDVSSSRTFRGTGDNDPLHFGNYFGPGMEFGSNFDQLGSLDKGELVAELNAPFSPGSTGRRLLKSHLFARHLPLLRGYFPAAHFIMVYRGGEACLDWWLKCGGFEIVFPDYSWYRDLQNMREQIAIDNASILEFAAGAGVTLARYRSFRRLFDALGLAYTPEHFATLNPTMRASLGAPEMDPNVLVKTLHSYAGRAQIGFL